MRVRIFLSLALLAWLTGPVGPGAAGEGLQPPPPPPPAKPPAAVADGFYQHNLIDALLRDAVVKAPLVIIGKITKAGEASGKGWEPATERDPGPKSVRISVVDVTQEAEVEVVEVLRGKLEAKNVSLKLDGLTLRHWHLREYFFSRKPLPMGFALPVGHFALRQDTTYIFLLNALKPEAAAAADARPAVSISSGSWPIVAGPARSGKARSLCQGLAEWDAPPKLSAEEEAAVNKLVAELDAGSFEARERAERGLRAAGIRTRPYLEKAAADPAFERARRAADILEDLKPEPGKTVIPWNAPDTGLYAEDNWRSSQSVAAESQLVVVGKVAEPGKIRGRGWQMKPAGAKGDADKTEPVPAGVAEVDLRQDLQVEVVEVLRGKLEGKALTVRLDQLRFPLSPLSMFYQRRNMHAPDYENQRLPARYFSPAKNETCVFFLGAPEAAAGDAAARPVAVHVVGFHPARGPKPELLDSLRSFCRVLAEWDTPAKLSDEEAARLKGLAADLGSDDFDKRDKAEAGLKAAGARARPYLEAAAADKDLERSSRAKDLLKAAAPQPGVEELPGAEAKDAPKPARPPKPPEAPAAEPEKAPKGD